MNGFVLVLLFYFRAHLLPSETDSMKALSLTLSQRERGLKCDETKRSTGLRLGGSLALPNVGHL